jgi:hypothetical protein
MRLLCNAGLPRYGPKLVEERVSDNSILLPQEST